MTTSIDTTPIEGLMLFGGKRYAVGLHWFSAIEQADSQQLIRQRAKGLQADYYCIRRHISQQHGFGWLSRGHRHRLPAAAAMVADRLVGEWHGVFEAENGWWYLQVHSDAISPEGDQFFATEEEAYNAFIYHSQTHNWAHAYAPQRWGLSFTSREVPLAALLDNFAPTYLQPLSAKAFFGGARPLGLVVTSCIALIALLLIGVGLWQWQQSVKMAEIVAVQTAAQEKTLPKVQEIPALTPPQEDMQEIIQTTNFMDVCQAQAARMVRPIPGWQLLQMSCQQNNLTVSWQQQTGTLQQARTVLGDLPFGATLQLNNNQLILQQPLGQWSKILQKNWVPQDQAILNLEQALQRFGRLQLHPMLNAPPNLNAEQVKPTGWGSGVNEQKNAATGAIATKTLLFRPYISIELTSPLAPEQVQAGWQTDGMELDSLSWDVTRQSWTYRGRLWLAMPKTAPAPIAGGSNTSSPAPRVLPAAP